MNLKPKITISSGGENNAGQKRNLKKIFLRTGACLAAALFVYWIFIFLGSEPTAQEEIDQIVKEVGALIILPEGEIPSVATVDDPEALKKDQQFFRLAQEGDRVLIYSQAGKAVLYRPSLGKIVDVATVGIEPRP